jgi:hypothetical protein
VRIFLQGDQYSRWHVRRSADDAMLDLLAWSPDMYLGDRGAYRPSRNHSPEVFPVSKPTLYSFRPRANPPGNMPAAPLHDNATLAIPLGTPPLVANASTLATGARSWSNEVKPNGRNRKRGRAPAADVKNELEASASRATKKRKASNQPQPQTMTRASDLQRRLLVDNMQGSQLADRSPRGAS